MKSQTRAWILTTALVLLWSTPVAAPFAYFSNLIYDLANKITGVFDLSAPLSVMTAVLLLLAAVAALLWFDHGRNRLYWAGYIALAEVVAFFIDAYKTDSVYQLPMPLSIGLALALLMMLIPQNTPGNWLSDAYILAIPAWLIVEMALSGFYSQFDWSSDLLAPLLIVPEQSPIFALQDWLSLPIWLWSGVVLAGALLPVILLAKGRAKG